MRIRNTIGAAALTLGLSGAPAGAEPVAPRPSAGCEAVSIAHGRPLERTLTVDSTRRAYLLDVPETIDPKQPAALLFDFHGFGHSAAGVWKVSRFKELAAVDRFITVYPDGLPVRLLGREGPGWQIFSADANRDLAFTSQLLDQLEREYCIDRARVFATGFSNGAFFSQVLACASPDRFAAIAPVGGGRITVPCAPARGIPVLIHHGRQDGIVPVAQARAARDAWIEKNRCREHFGGGCEGHRACRDGAEVIYCEDDGGHHWPPAATERIWSFFRRHAMR